MRIAFSWFNGGPYVLNGAWILPKLVDTIVGLLVNSALTLKMIVARTRNSFCFAKNHSMSANFNKHKMTNFKSIYQILRLLTILPLYKSHNAKFYSEIDDYQKTIEVNLIYLTKLCMSFILSTKLKILNLTTESKLDSCHRNWIGNFDLKISIQTQPHSAWIHM